MPSRLADAHIESQARLRRLTVEAVARIWADLPGHDRANVPQWLSSVLPVVETSQRTSVALTEAYIATFLGRRVAGVDPAKLTGAAVRNGTPPAEVYHRPFVTLWSKLGEGVAYPDALNAGLARVRETAAMDVQLSMRATAAAIDSTDSAIYGYQRVADPGACEFCQAVDGAYVKGSGYVMALHNNCGCSLEPLTEPHPRAVSLPDGTPIRPYQYGPLNDNVAVHEHGELGPILGSPDHDFTSKADI